MNIDKKNGAVSFCEDAHAYWLNGDENNRCISVTTLIGMFHEKFDANFWGRYKALEKLLPKDAFYIEKKKLLTTKKFDDTIIDRYDIDRLTFNTMVNDIIDGYDEEKRKACERGTKYHLEQEMRFYDGKPHELSKFGLGGTFTCKPKSYDLDVDRGVFPEYLIYRESPDGILKIAGQIDLLIKDGNTFTIVDYKTNGKIDKKGFFDQNTKTTKKMFYPLNNLDDTNFSHYTMQLSTYAWMVEQLNPKYKIGGLYLFHHAHDGSDIISDVEYKKQSVIRMLQFYKKQKKIELEKLKNKPIDF